MKIKKLKRTVDNIENQVKKQKHDEPEETSYKDLNKPPTVEELNQLRETEILFNSNLFRLQTEELIKEVSIKDKRKREINLWLENFKTFLNNMPEYDDYNLSDFGVCLDTVKSKKLKGIMKQIRNNIPLSLQTDQDAPVKLVKPCKTHLVGLYPLDATIGPEINVTINIVVPKICFHAKDYLNARYLVKRAIYLSYVATHFKSHNMADNCLISYSFLNGNELHPLLHITTDIKKTIFEVIVSPAENTFKLNRFDADKSNLRWTYYKNLTNCEEEIESMAATPWYNSILWHDVSLGERQTAAETTLEGLMGLRAALKLLSVWLRQRLLQINDQLLMDLVTSFAKNGRLHRHQSSYQAVRVLFTHLSTAEWNNCLIPTERIRQEAQKALLLLDQADLTAFQLLFMTPMPFTQQYDAIINVFNCSELQNVYDEVESDKKLDYLTYKYPLLVGNLCETLRSGLTDRAECIVPKPKEAVVWSVGSLPSTSDLLVTFGIKFDPSNMYRVIDKGPTAYDPQASIFRSFWGDKAELRRFKDGTICEAVYWPAEFIRDKRRISKNIIEYILKDKFKLEKIKIMYDQLDNILDKNIEEANLKVITEFDELAKKLRDLKLPLSVASVQGISEAFSHSDPYPPQPKKYDVNSNNTWCRDGQIRLRDQGPQLKTCPEFIASVKAVMQLQQHSAWPGDLGAVRALRGALLLDAAKGLKRAGLPAKASYAFLHVVSGGLTVRVDLYHPREAMLSGGKREMQCVLLPRLRGALAGMHAQCPAFGPAAALAQRWLRAQLLELPPTITELLVAAGCVAERVALPQRAFLRFLSLLANYPWKSQPLILDITDEMTAEQREELETEFRIERDVFPPMCLITPWDLKSRVTAEGPGAQLLHRLGLLATQVLQLVEKHAHSSDQLCPVALFKPNLSGYNAIINLNTAFNTRTCEALFNKFNTGQTTAEYDATDSVIPVVDFNPVEIYLQELRTNYDDFAVFFHDIHGGDVIAVLWKPNITEKNNFKVQQIAGTKLLTNEQLIVNIDSIIEDFYILGNGLVKNIEIIN